MTTRKNNALTISAVLAALLVDWRTTEGKEAEDLPRIQWTPDSPTPAASTAGFVAIDNVGGLKVAPLQTKTDRQHDFKAVLKLARSIAKEGYIEGQPITADKTTVHAGHRRLMAVELLRLVDNQAVEAGGESMMAAIMPEGVPNEASSGDPLKDYLRGEQDTGASQNRFTFYNWSVLFGQIKGDKAKGSKALRFPASTRERLMMADTMGILDCIVPEERDENGKVIRPATSSRDILEALQKAKACKATKAAYEESKAKAESAEVKPPRLDAAYVADIPEAVEAARKALGSKKRNTQAKVPAAVWQAAATFLANQAGSEAKAAIRKIKTGKVLKAEDVPALFE